MTENTRPFTPPRSMRNPHLQTILSSTGRKLLRPGAEKQFMAAAQAEVMTVTGAKLLVHTNLRPQAPLAMIIPGWLGSHQSSYVLSTGLALWRAGYSVVRINLRDHGGTTHLNEDMFNSAMLDEVVELVDQLRNRHGARGHGLMGFSLGGNFALRLARALPELPTLAVCPAMEPADTMYRIDRSTIYQRYFINKWRRTWAEKQQAFPHRYAFGDALQLKSVSALTDYFVRYHSDFSSTQAYFDAYDVSGDALQGVRAHILAAADDPIIPHTQYEKLPDSITLDLTPHGGHGAYLESWGLRSWADDYAVDFFRRHVGAAPTPQLA